jgi:hypothetical protein
MDISPPRKWIPMFERPEMDTDSLPRKPLAPADGTTVRFTQ